MSFETIGSFTRDWRTCKGKVTLLLSIAITTGADLNGFYDNVIKNEMRKKDEEWEEKEIENKNTI